MTALTSFATWTGVALAAALAGCSLPLPNDQDDAVARGAVDQLRRGDFKALLAQSGPEMRTADAQAAFPSLKAMFPSGDALSVKRTGWRSNANLGEQPMLTLDEAYEYPDRTVTAEVAMSQAGAPHRWVIRGIQVNSRMKAPPVPAAPPAPGRQVS